MALTPWGKRHEKIEKAEEFLTECCEALHLPKKQLTKSAKEWVSRRQWSDNPQEMRRLMYTAALLSPGTDVDAVAFPPRLCEDHEAFHKAHFKDLSLEAAISEKLAHFFQRIGRHEVTDLHEAVVQQMERPLIHQALEWAEGNQLKAARVLGMHRNTLRKKIQKLRIKK